MRNDWQVDGGIRVEPRDPTSAEAQELIDELSDVLALNYGSSGRDGFIPDDEGAGLFLVALVGGHLAGCGALRPMPENDGVAEIKRMYSRPGTSGVGRAVLASLEFHAWQRGFSSIWLETRRANLGAVRFYERAGYIERSPYGKYAGRPEAICLEKNLSSSSQRPSPHP